MHAIKNLSRMFVLQCALISSTWALSDPQAIVKETAEQLMQEVSEHRTALEENPEKVYALADKYASRYFDYPAMAKMAVGRFWRQATPNQQARLTAEFKQLIVRTYGTALLQMAADLSIEYPSYRYSQEQTALTVPTRMRLAGGPAVPVNYRVIKQDNAWRVIDITVDGISLVTNYRSTFKREIQLGAAGVKGAKRMHAGIERLIQSLNKKNSSDSNPQPSA